MQQTQLMRNIACDCSMDGIVLSHSFQIHQIHTNHVGDVSSMGCNTSKNIFETVPCNIYKYTAHLIVYPVDPHRTISFLSYKCNFDKPASVCATYKINSKQNCKQMSSSSDCYQDPASSFFHYFQNSAQFVKY
jgi:hypothetical protein